MRERGRFFGLLAFALLVGCGDGEQAKNAKKELGEAWDAVKAWGVAQRADAEKAFSKGVDDLSKSYEGAKAKARVSGADAEKALDAKWSDVAQKLTELKAAGADKWVEARDRFVRAYEAFKREISTGS